MFEGSIDTVIAPWPASVGLFIGMVACFEIGRRLGIRNLARDATGAMAGHTAVENSVFALFGLLVAFTFVGAPTRFDMRRLLLAEEVSKIDTAYMRVDLLPSASRPPLHELFKQYLDSRLRYFQMSPEIEAAKAEYLNTKRLQERIWEQATPATRLPEAHPDAGRLLLPALNAMFDITTTRLMASRLHPPPIIFYLLFILASLCSLLVGYGMAAAKRRRWLHVLAFSLTVVISVFVILDIEDPRSGYIRLDPYDQALVDLRAAMK